MASTIKDMAGKNGLKNSRGGNMITKDNPYKGSNVITKSKKYKTPTTAFNRRLRQRHEAKNFSAKRFDSTRKKVFGLK